MPPFGEGAAKGTTLEESDVLDRIWYRVVDPLVDIFGVQITAALFISLLIFVIYQLLSR